MESGESSKSALSNRSLFSSVKFYLSGNVREEVIRALKDGGAEGTNYFSDFVTHCIIGDNYSDNDLCDARDLYEVPAIIQDWVSMSVHCNKLLPTKAFQAPDQCLFIGISVCLSQVSQSDCKTLWALVTFNGGTCTLTLNRKTTHLITTKTDHAKYDYALNKANNSIKIVTPDWLIDSVQSKTICNESLYHPRLLISPKVTSPSSTTAHITGFEDVDSTVQSSLEVKDNGDLEQLKQRLPWNQLSSNDLGNSSESQRNLHNTKFTQPTSVLSSVPQSKTVSSIAVSQIGRSQSQLLHISGVQMHQQNNQILQIPTQPSQTVQGPTVSTVPSSMLSTSTMQMLTSSSNVPQTVTMSNTNAPQPQSIGLTQFLHSSTSGVTNQLTTLSNSNQTQNKVQFVPQQLLIQGQQGNQQSPIMHPQQLILQKRNAPHPQQRILVQQVTPGGITTTHWRSSNVVQQQTSQGSQQQIQVGNQFTLSSSPNVTQVNWQQQQQQQQQQQHHQQQQMQQKQNVGMNPGLVSPQQQKHMPPQSPINQQLNQLLNHSPESSQHQFNQPINSPIQPQSPQQFSQPHSNSSAPPHSPMYQSQPAPSPTGSANYSYLHSGPPSVQSHYNQPASPMPSQSPRHVSQFVHPSSSPAHPQSPYTSHDPENTGGGGGNPMSYVNAIPIPEEFRRLGIKPGLLGGSPAWAKTKKTKILAHEFEKYGIKGGLLGGTPTWNEKPEENNVEKVENVEKNATVEDGEMKPCSSKSSAQFYTIEEDVDSRDSAVFFSLPEKTIKKSPSAESPNDFENTEFQGCGTPKTLDDSIELPVYKDVPLVDGCKSEEMNASDDSMELPMYKDVRLIEGCKSEENSLCFPAAIEDNEISLPLGMDTSGLHLALDSGDVRSDDLLDDCLVSSDLLVLDVNEDQEIIEEIKYTPDTVTSTPLRTTSVVQTTTTISTVSKNNLANEIPSSCEETNTINHSVISTHAFHSYAKIVKTENGEDSVDTKEESEPELELEPRPETEPELKQEQEMEPKPEPEPEPESEPVPDEKMETETSEVIEKPKQELIEAENIATSVETTKAIVASVVTTIPSRTTSVLQMTPVALTQCSTTPTTKEVSTTSAEPPPPVYTENFHSYVKKLPKTNEDDNFEKDKQLFDETLMKIKTENMTVEEGQEEQPVDDKKEPDEDISTDARQSPPVAVTTTTASATTTAVAQYQATNSVITKDTKLVSPAHSTSQNQPKEPTTSVQSTPQPVTGTMFPPRVRPSDDSQNVLLKQLLQNSGSGNITHSTMTQHVTKPPPSPSYKSPPANTIAEVPATTTTTTVDTVIAQVSESQPKPEPRVQYAPVQTAVPTTVIKQEISVPSTSARKEVPTIVPATQTATPTSSTMSPMHIDIKKEIVTDELISPQFKTADVPDTPNSVSGDSSTGSVLDAQDLKKLKRRQYQAKRRQSQSKDNAAIPKKRNRRVSKVDEDYDTFVDGLMTRIRQLPRIEITEPLLIHNYAACLPYGAGDGTKISLKTWVNGELFGTYGSFKLSKRNDYYNTEPFGDEEAIPQPAVSPPTNDFYNVELPPLNLEADYEERRLELARMDRELDTPDSVISSSSPECIIPHTPSRFAGLRLIDENGSGVDSEEDEKLLKRISPVIPLVVPLALRPRVQYQNDAFIQDKENYGKSTAFSLKSRYQPCIPLKDKANLSVTLTFNSRAAQDIVGVLKNLATVLNIAPPVTYKVSDRIPTPNKINPFGNKINDDVEEVELEKYSDGSTKYCQHCKTTINAYTSVKKKASEVPFVVQDGVSDDLLFCSTSCYLQMILLVPPVISEQKVSSSDDHVSEPSPRKKMRLERSNDPDVSEVSQVFKVTDAKSGKDISYVEKTSLTPESTTKSDHVADKKQLKGVKYRTWSIDSIPPPVQKYKTPTEKEITETLFRMKITVMPKEMPDDMRSCIFCQQSGDGVANGPSRLLNYDVDKWAHLNCSLWSDGVYETQNGALMNVDAALKTGVDVTCTYCKRNGATLKCFKLRCSKVYHLSCAMKSGCCFLENKSVFCEEHLSKAEINRVLTTLAVYRRVYIDRDENRQIASVIKHAELTHLMRIGSLIFLNVGQLLPHQLQEFHTPNFIYPVGYKVIRFYWSMRVFNKRCQYVCSIHDVAGRPEFRILIQEQDEDDLELRGSSPNAVWTRILEPLAKLRKSNQSVQLFPCYVTGDYLFGLTEPAIVRILENLPGIETLGDYTFKFGRDPLLELPLAVNPSGCARCEPRVRGPPLKRTHTQRTSSVMPRPVLTSSPLFSGDLSCPYSKHFVHSKSSQYKKMKQEWRNHVYLARSKIQGLGLYAARDIDKHTMVIEYIGEIIRSQLSDFREKQYEAKNRGVYMFRLDENRVVDATISGGLARYINHSCNPNCITEKVEVDREYRIIIFSKRRIVRGEELSYDYQFDIEDDMHKIPCLCGAPNCRKWMN